MTPHRQHYAPAPQPMHPLLAAALDHITALACALGIAIAITHWSL
jgi:hypothetical protein